MSQRRGGRGRGRKRGSSHSQEVDEEEEEVMEETQSQSTNHEAGEEGGGGGGERVSSRAKKAFNSLDKETIDRKVGEVVRYLLCAARRKAPVRKSELIDKAIGHEFSSSFSCLIPIARERLREIFGIEMKEVAPRKTGKQPTAVRYYILTNQILPPIRETLLPWSQKEKEEQGLLFVILAIVMLKDGSVQEESLFNILRHLNISSSSHHSVFGDVEHLIKKDFVEAKYLDRSKTLSGDQYRYIYHWGPRAEVTVDKRNLLQMVAELHGDNFTRWEKQFGHMISQQD